MTNNKDAKKAAEIIKHFKLESKDFPEINERLQKNCVRWHLSQQEWFMVEDIFCLDPQFLAFAVEDLYFKGKKNEAYTIAKRHNLLE